MPTRYLKHLLVAIFAIGITTLFFSLAPVARAVSQSPSGSAWVPNASVTSIVPAGDGVNNFISGTFDVIGPPTGSFVPLDKTTGLLATQVFPKVDNSIFAMVSDGDGGWYIGGRFTQVGGYSRNHLAHIRSDMTVDAGWDPDVNLDVLALYLDSGLLYLGGSFTEVGGQTRNYLAAVNADTGTVTPWNPAPDWEVWTIAVEGATAYIGGAFSEVNGVTRNQAAAIRTTDGSLLAWDPDPDYYVRVLKIHGDKLFMGGDFFDVHSNSTPVYRGGLAQFELSDGSLTTWSPITDNSVTTMRFNGTTMYIGGDFNDVGGQTRNGIAEIDLATGTPTAWDPDLDWGDAYAIVRDGSMVYIGGSWDTVGGVRRAYLAAVDSTTGAVTSWDPVAGGDVNVMELSGNTVFAAGSFNSINGMVRDNIAKVNATTGVVDAAFSANLGPNSGGPLSLAVAAGKVYGAGGVIVDNLGNNRSFTSFDATTGAITSLNPTINCCAKTVSTDGTTVYVGGSFLTVNGQDRWKIAAFDAATDTLAAWQAPHIFNGNSVDTVNAIALSGTTAYLGGSFRSVTSGAGTVPRNGLAAFDRVTGALLPWDPNANAGAVVNALAINSGTLYVGGQFSVVGGQSRNNIAAVDASSGAVTAWDPDAGWFVAPPAFPVLYPYVQTLSLQGSTIYAGGRFTSIGGAQRERLAAIDVATGLATAWSPDVFNSSYQYDAFDAPIVQNLYATASTVYIGGYFDQVGAQYQTGLAMFQSLPPLRFHYFSAEGDETITAVNLELQLQDTFSSDVLVNYAVSGGSATGGGVDYTLSSGLATISSGLTSTSIPVSIVDDGMTELPELIQVTLSGPVNATLSRIPTMLYRITDGLGGVGPAPTPTSTPTPTSAPTATPIHTVTATPHASPLPTNSVSPASGPSALPQPGTTMVSPQSPMSTPTPSGAAAPVPTTACQGQTEANNVLLGSLGQMTQIMYGFDRAVQSASHFTNRHQLKVARYAVRQYRVQRARHALLAALSEGRTSAMEENCSRSGNGQHQEPLDRQSRKVRELLEKYHQSVVNFVSWVERASRAQSPDEPFVVSLETPQGSGKPHDTLEEVDLYEEVAGSSFKPLGFIPLIGPPAQILVEGMSRSTDALSFYISLVVDTSLGWLEQLPIIGPAIETADVHLTNLAESPASFIALPVALFGLVVPYFWPIGQSLPGVSIWQLPGIFLGMLRKKRHPWGVVFDAETKQPLDPVVLTLTNSHGQRWQTVSDYYGRYEFLVSPGTYVLKAEKTHYRFPAQKEAARQDDVYDDLYFGGELAVQAADLINVNVPMDALAADWNQAEKMRLDDTRRRQRLVRASKILFGLGLSWSLAMFVLFPNLLNTLIMVAYAVFILWRLRAGRRPWGTILDGDGNPVEGAVVRLVNVTLPQVKRPPVVTRPDGRYVFLVERGSYRVSVEMKGADGAFVEVATTETLKITDTYGQIQADIRLPLP